MNRIEQNEKLRERIVDLADLWDGAVSQKFGDSLQFILDELGIKDMPKFYSEDMQNMIDEIQKEKNDKKEPRM